MQMKASKNTSFRFKGNKMITKQKANIRVVKKITNPVPQPYRKADKIAEPSKSIQPPILAHFFRERIFSVVG